MILDNVDRRRLPNGRLRLSAQAFYDRDHGNGRGDFFHFDYPPEVEADLVDSGDPWLVLFLPISVVLGESLKITRPVDPALLQGCLEVLEIWRCWMPELPVIEVEADTASPAAVPGGRTGSFFSGGVDSMHTLLRHEDSPGAPRAERIDDLITILGIFGREKELVDQDRAAPMRKRMAGIAHRFGKGMVEVHTNAYQSAFRLTNSLNHSHSCLMAAAVLGMGTRYSRVLIPSSITYADAAPGGSHPLTDRLLSTTATRLVPDACDVVRFQKVAYLAARNHDLASLQVCSRDLDLKNCCGCFKCVRAMLILEVLGKLGQCELFREPELDLEKVAGLYCSTKQALVDFELALGEANKQGREEVVFAIETLFRRSAWIYSCRVLIGKLRQGRVPEGPERDLLAQLLKSGDCRHCSEQTRAMLDTALEVHTDLRAYLGSVLEGIGPRSDSANSPGAGTFRILEHALLGASICESTLDIQLRDPGQELCEPKVIYVDGLAHAVSASFAV